MVWAQELGWVDRFGIEGRGSYGAGLTSYLRRCGHRVVEQTPGRSPLAAQQRQIRRHRHGSRRPVGPCGNLNRGSQNCGWAGRDDPPAQDSQRHRPQRPNFGDHHRRGNDRQRPRPSCARFLDGLTNRALINRCARYRVSAMNSPTASSKHSPKSVSTPLAPP